MDVLHRLIAWLVEMALTLYVCAHGAPLDLEATPRAGNDLSQGTNDFVCVARRYNSWNVP